MVSGENNNQNQNPGDERDKRLSNNSDVLGGGSLSGGQSVSSTSGSMGSPSRSDQAAVTTPISERRIFPKLNNLDIQNNSNDTPSTIGGTKKKRGQRAVGADKAGRGLRQFSMRVCEKVESKGKTTYNQVADELVVEFADPTNNLAPDQQQYDEKNIRRRVYDALNVLMAMDIISKDKKEIQWRGLPRTTKNDIEEFNRERLALKKSIDTKARYLQELEKQYVGLENLISRNEKLFSSGNAPSGGVHLPFILVQTLPHATVELEISEDMQLVHFDFNSTPFELHDDNYVLKAMKFCERPSGDVGHAARQVPIDEEGKGCNTPRMYHPQPQIPQLCKPKTPGRPPASPLPGIMEARVKNEKCSISDGFSGDDY